MVGVDTRDARRGDLLLRSPMFGNEGFMPAWCGRGNGDIPPDLEWDVPPAGTVETAIVCADEDCPEGHFSHWLVSRIPPTVTSIRHGLLPAGAVESLNDFGEIGWGGPYLPAGNRVRRYSFRIRAVSQALELGPASTITDLSTIARGRELASATLVGRFSADCAMFEC